MLFISNSVFAGGISGNFSVCLNGTATHAGREGTIITYSATGFSNPTSYRWSVLGSSGAHTYASPIESTCQIFFPNSMNDRVTGTILLETSEGSASANFTVYRLPSPAKAISGQRLINIDTDLNRTFTYTTTALESGTLVWGTPSGSTIVSQGSNYVVLKFLNTFRGGTLRVFGVNGPCGAGEPALFDIDGQKEVIVPSLSYTPQSSVPDINNRNLTSKEVGFSPNFIDVSTSGAAVVNYPIFVPPGTAGLEPDISINYNSQAGYGELGLGWHLSASSSITRVGQNKYLDGRQELLI